MPVEKAASTLSRRKIRGASESVKLGGGTSITSSSKRAVVASGSVELRPRIAASWERAVIIGSDLVEPRGDMSVALNSQHAVVDGSESFESSGGITSNWERAEVVASGSVESVGGESMLKPTEDLTSSSFMRKCADCGTTFDRWRWACLLLRCDAFKADGVPCRIEGCACATVLPYLQQLKAYLLEKKASLPSQS